MRVRTPARILGFGVAGLVSAGSVVFTNRRATRRGRSATRVARRTCRSSTNTASPATTKTTKRVGSSSRILSDDVSQHPEVWEKVVRKLRARQMPPVGKKRPNDAAYDAVVAALETTLDRAAAAHPNYGRTATIRRRREPIQERGARPPGVDVDVSSLLPADESSYGFDNVTVTDLLADPPRSLRIGRGEDQPRGGRAPDPFAGGETYPGPCGRDPGRPSRGPSDRHSRRRGGQLHLSSRWRVQTSPSG